MTPRIQPATGIVGADTLGFKPSISVVIPRTIPLNEGRTTQPPPPRCSATTTLTLTFSGVSLFPSCARDLSSSIGLSNTAISLSGVIVVSLLAPNVWTAIISNAYTYDLYSNITCTVIDTPNIITDLNVSLTCSEVNGYSVQVSATNMSFNYAYDADGPVIFSTLLPAIGDSAANGRGAGGSVTLSV